MARECIIDYVWCVRDTRNVSGDSVDARDVNYLVPGAHSLSEIR